MTSLCGNLTSALGPRCFVELSASVSSGVLAYVTLLLTVYLRWSKPRDDARRLFSGHTLRCVLSLLFLLVHLCEFGEILAGGRSWILAGLSCFSWFCVQGFYFTIEKYGRAHYLAATSLLYLVCGLVRGVLLYTLLEEIDMTYVSTLLSAVSSALAYAVSLNDLVTLINEVKLEKDERKLPLGEYESYVHKQSHWFSRLTFFWLTPLLRIGYTNPLEPEDLGKLPLEESAAEQYQNFLDSYQKIKNARGVASLWKCYFHCYWKNFFVGGLLKLIGDFVGLIAPLGIAVVIDYVASYQQPASQAPSITQEDFVSVNVFLKNGYVMSIVIFVSAIAQASFSQASTHIINVEGIRLKTALQGMIYAKTLKLSISNKDDESSTSDSKYGTTTNLMSEDTFNIMTCFWIGHYIWAIPLKISVLMYLLYCQLGLSAIIGALFCIITMTPLQFLIGKKMSDNSKIISNLCDERLRMTNEMLQGIKVLKLCGWELQFYLRIMSARNNELRYLNKDSLFWALMTFFTHTSSSLITLVTLGAYYYLEGTNLSVSSVFSALALFNQLTVPLFIFPITVPIIISALTSTQRLEDFLALPESTSYSPLDVSSHVLKPGKTQHTEKDRLFGLGGISEEADDKNYDDDLRDEEDRSKEENACILREAGFSWCDQEKPGLWINNLNIPKGKLTAVIGRVGCGKTSFLHALLGEMKCVSGLMKWEKGVSFAYVSQQPWLLNATLRENVLMGLSYKMRRFSRVIAATALQPDIDILPNKDLTELGEKGVNLSGGQRQRIAIARALYSKANVIILDDPLSALDYHVAQHVFEHGIMNLVLKQRKTVVMVTHSLHLLTYAHKVVALESGRMRACGKLTDMELVDGVVTGVDTSGDSRGRTARERWQLVKLVSRIGHHIRQQNMKYQNKQLFIPFRKRLSTGSEYYWAQDLPLPSSIDGERDMPLQRSTTLPRHRPVARASSLQPHSSSHMNPVTRQASSPIINQGTRGRTYTFDGVPPGGNLLKHIFMSSNKNMTGVEPQTNTNSSIKEKNLLQRLMSTTSIKSVVFNENEKRPIQRLPSTCSDYSDECYDEDEDLEPDWCGTNTVEERQYGTISPYVYFTYLRACGVVAAIGYLILAMSWQVMRVYTDFWLSKWTQGSEGHNDEETLYYLIMYTGLSFTCVLISLLSNLLGQYSGARARRRLHKNMLLSVVRLPLKVFETTPLGRILARFSTDINVIDKKLATSIQRLIQFLLLCFSAILVNSIVTPWFLILAVPICIFYYIIQRFYRCSSRELQRLDSMSRTPILSHLTETLSGLETIRAFKQQRRFTVAMFYKFDSHTNAFLIANSATRWLGIALDYLGAVIVLLAMVVSLVCSAVVPDVVTPALVGLAINYTLLVPIYLNWVVKFLSDVEMYMAGVERICHYIKMPSEDYKQINQRSFLKTVISPKGLIWKNWPSKGMIKFDRVSLRYDHSQEIAVTNLNLVIPPGQKVGICGRTGSGKSSLVMSLFGMTPVIEGIIFIDDVDISTAPLQYLRSRLSVIPQDVIMFSGTIRENLDLDSQYSDAQLWEALELAQLKEIVSSQLGGLNGLVREGGVNLSSGQRQLLCLARAILRQTACLIMDEATSSLDVTTEKTLIHAAEKAFANKTIITIAHRLTTLLSCDRILVLESGRIVEDGSPAELLNRSMGIFSTMLRSAESHHNTHP
ncbi:ATP-binding cassette sub-family C member Sur isoform X2 [Cimex lectularius]|uniref:ABC Transporter n=1 Tax=Cimex lectularius TaxID=79782 RepID=A0A8I6R9P6_CIMLE|nr:ATP-binding cassette sub-family C member Sur isoform X2 [Cimex lectularius]